MGDAIAQIELALLEPLHLQQVGAGRDFESRDGHIEVAMLLLQPRQLLPQLAFFLFGHRHRWYPASEGPHSCKTPSGSDTSTVWLVLDLTVRSILAETIGRSSLRILLIFKELRQLVGKFAGFSRYCNRGIAAMHASNERRHGRRLV